MTNAVALRLVRLLQLASPVLPVGAYSYSHALEAAVAATIVQDSSTAEIWIGDVLDNVIGRLEGPLLLRLIYSWRTHDYTSVNHWNAFFLAARETAELRAETLQMGYSLSKLLAEMEGTNAEAIEFLVGVEEITFPTAFAFAVAQWEIPADQAVVAYLWAWVENQVMAAIKLVPLGQTDGQRLLLTLGAKAIKAAEGAALLDEDEIGSFAPGLAIFSSAHETQYSRLFRS
jgi:urease accessory protein